MKKGYTQKITKVFISWRLWLFIPLFLATFLIPFRENNLFTTIWQYSEKQIILENKLVYPWSNFDGVHYIGIASRGYIDEGRFMPLYPLLIFIDTLPFKLIFDLPAYHQLYFWSGLLLSNLFFFLALRNLYKLFNEDTSSSSTFLALLLLISFPTAFYFGMVYTESLFLFLASQVFLFEKRKKWLFAILTSSLLTITRLPGILILIPLLMEFLRTELKIALLNPKSYTKLLHNWKRLLPFLLIPIPLILYSYYNYVRWDDFLYFVHAHGNLGNSREVGGLVFPLVTVYRYFKILTSVSPLQYEFFVAALELTSLVIAGIGIVISYLKKIRPSYQVYTLLILSLPLFSGTLSGFPRYLLLAFPLFLAFSLQLQDKKITKFLVLFLGLMIQALLLMLISRGWYIS